tara:strand:+ start:44 stop:964 length:921 start_codon:yes stop_codon:yes gene_type:complete
MMVLVGFLPLVVVGEKRKNIYAKRKSSNAEVEKIKQAVKDKNFEEVIDYLELTKEQRNPYTNNLKRLQKEFTIESFVKKIEEISEQSNYENVTAKLSESLGVNEADVSAFMSISCFKDVETLAMTEVIAASMMMGDLDFVERVYSSQKSQFSDGWGTLIMLLVFPKDGSMFANKISEMKRIYLFERFFKEYDTKEKIIEFVNEFISTHPSYSYLYSETENSKSIIANIQEENDSSEDIDLAPETKNMNHKNEDKVETNPVKSENNYTENENAEIEKKLETLKSLYNKKLISKATYEDKQKSILDRL